MSVKVTVLMPAYNAGKYIAEAIDSVLAQTFGDFELLIVNDGSTDNTEAVVKQYTDQRIKLLNQPNGGVSQALNTGLQQASGKYIARFDADDICFPQRLEKQYHFMEAHPEYILIGSDVDYMSEEGNFIFTFHNPGHSHEEILANYMQSCPFVHSSVMYKKEVVQALGGYEVKAHTFEDYFLWVKLIGKGKVCNFKESLIKVRFNPSSVTVDERDYEPVFIQLKQKALKTGIITDAEGLTIKESIKKLRRSKKEGSYHRMLGKKYLWNNYQPAMARRHLFKSLAAEPLSFTAYALLLVSLFPAGFISWLYNKTNT